MKLKLTFLLILLTLSAEPCGYDESEIENLYYNILPQESISEPLLFPFLNEPFSLFHTDQNHPSPNAYLGNFLLWQRLLPNWSVEELETVLNHSSEIEFNKLWFEKTGLRGSPAKDYMELARQCADLFAFRASRAWDYDDILRNKVVDVTELLSQTLRAFHDENEQQLKARYAYQILRIYHYSELYTEAIAFYEISVKDKFEKNEIYYYCLNHVAGCHYSLSSFAEAAYLFLQVFDQSRDRKQSAALSFKHCLRDVTDISGYLNSSSDSLAFYTLQAWIGYGSFQAFKKACEIEPSNPKTELLFMRALNTIEISQWPQQKGIQYDGQPMLSKDELQQVLELVQLSDSLSNVPEILNRDFWLISTSYLLFVEGHYAEAKQKLANVKSTRFRELKTELTHVYEVFGWTDISLREEKYLVVNLSNVFKVANDSRNYAPQPPWIALITDQIAHLYYQNGKLAESFLCHNRLLGIDGISAPELVNDLQAFLETKTKTDFEKLLEFRAGEIPEQALAYVYQVKGMYYLQEADPKSALPYFEKSDSMVSNLPLIKMDNLRISRRIFSNNTKECFHCDERDMMLDSVCLADVFTFIKPYFNRTELAQNLLTLDSLAQGAVLWKVKLANYLLGNYYFNVSNTGYFRGTLTGDVNCCHYSYLEKHRTQSSVSEQIEQGKGFNLSDVLNYQQTYFGLARKALSYYQKVLDNSTDMELNARTLYMMAKCELNQFYNNESSQSFPEAVYEGGIQGDWFGKSFFELNENYKQTRFYKETIKECSFFRYYVNSQ